VEITVESSISMKRAHPTMSGATKGLAGLDNGDFIPSEGEFVVGEGG
jgi:hypothetical protein